MSLTYFSINIEADLHLDLISQYLASTTPDVICLQEVYRIHAESFAKQFGYNLHFAPNVDFRIYEGIFKPLGEWGVAILTKLTPQTKTLDYYSETPVIIPHEFLKVLRHPRALISVTLQHNDQEYIFATTHFTWALPHNADKEQAPDYSRFKKLITTMPSFVLAGDFNAPRESLVYQDLSRQYLSHIPLSVESTLDPELFRKKELNLKLVVDHLFSTKDYLVENVQVLTGLSDHRGISATITRV